MYPCRWYNVTVVMCPSRCFDGTDACSENVTGVSVWEIGCTYRSGETADACSEIVIWMGV